MNKQINNEPLSLSRRSFLLRASMILAAAAAFSTVARAATSTTKQTKVANQSMFTPKTGSRTKFLGRWFSQFRIR